MLQRIKDPSNPHLNYTSAICAVSALLAAGLISPSMVRAADAPAASEDLAEIVVVGSRIRRTNLDSPSPVQVITREESTSAGFSSTTEALQSTGVTAGASQINNAYGGFVTDGGPGANTLSLRSLGASRTLVLINGRRVAPAGTRGAVGSADLNVLPSALVDRIEVLKDGASSIYGSDAIAGVVNVITLQNINTFTVEGQYNRPFESGGEQGRLSLVGGTSSDRWRISGSAELLKRRDLKLKDRDWTRCNTDYLLDRETGARSDAIDPLTGQPKCYPITFTGSNGVTINTIGTPARPGVPAANNVGTAFNRWRPNSSVTTGVVGFEGVNNGTFITGLNVRDTFEPRMLEESLISPAEIATGFVQGSYDLQALGNGELYSELLYHRRDSEQTGYRQLTMDYRFGSIQIPSNLVFPTAFLAPQATTGGVPVGVRGFIGFGNDTSSQELTYYKPTVGIRGDLTFASGWRYDAYMTFSKSDASYTFESFLTDKVANASDVIASPVGTPANLNFGGVTCRINTTNPAEACVPFPRLNTATISGNLPQNFKDYIFRPVTGNTKYEETVFSAAFDGPLLDMPYGALQGVVGVEHRRAKINDQPDPNSVASNLFNLTSSLPTAGSDDVSEVFVELEAPLLADLPFANELTVNASYRITDYKSYGSDSTYKFGVVFSPVDWVSLRATTGTSYRAPALYEQFQGATTGFLAQANDPCNDYGAKSVIRARNCATQIPGNPTFQATLGITVLSLGSAAANLEAETSKNTTVGLIFEPKLGDIGELSFSADFFDVRIDNGVAQAGAGNILTRCYDDPSFNPSAGFCRLLTRGAVAPFALTVQNAYTNLATEISRGFDYTLRFEREVGPGKLRVTSQATQYRKQANKLFADETLDDYNGNIENPEWTGSIDAAYTTGRWRVRYGIDVVGKMDSTAFFEEAPPWILDTATYITHFGSVRYRDSGWEVTAGVRNIFNKEPPQISSGYYNRVGNAPLYSGFDYVGRTGFLSIAKEF
jgi:iron complex outermembrane recepter protein